MYENKKENRPYTNTIRIQLYTILFNYDLIRPNCEIKLSYPKIVWHSCDSCKFCNKFKQAKNICINFFHFLKKQVFFVSQSFTASSLLQEHRYPSNRIDARVDPKCQRINYKNISLHNHRCILKLQKTKMNLKNIIRLNL